MGINSKVSGYEREHPYALQMIAQGQITGSGAGTEADVNGNHIVLDRDAELLGVRASCLGGAGLVQANVEVYLGTTKAGTQVLSAPMDLSGASQNKAEGTLAASGVIYPAGSEFCVSEDSTATTIDQLQVTMMFRDVPS